MVPITYAQNIIELRKLFEHGFREFVVSQKNFSRTLETNEKELLEILSFKNKNKDIKIFFEFDILVDEADFHSLTLQYSNLPLIEFDAVRIYDLGVMEWIKNQFPWQKIHLILETGNHNLVSLLTYEAYLGNQLSRFVVSIELSKDVLKNFTANLKTPCELYVLGPILLFYTPRKLLSPLVKTSEKNSLKSVWTKATSEESPHSGFPVLENQHGTFMFNVKDLNLLEDLNMVAETGAKYFRFDLRFENMLDHVELVSKVIFQNEIGKKLIGPRPFIKGFFNVNKSDVLFKKLKNNRIIRNDQNYVGEVIDVEKDRRLTIISKNNSVLNRDLHKLRIITPEGKEKIIEQFNFLDLNLDACDKLANEDLYFLNYIRGVTVKSQVYFFENK